MRRVPHSKRILKPLIVALAIFSPLFEHVAVAKPNEQVICIKGEARVFDPKEFEEDLKESDDQRPWDKRTSFQKGEHNKFCRETITEELDKK